MTRIVSLVFIAAAMVGALTVTAVPLAPKLLTPSTVKETQPDRLVVEDDHGRYTVVADPQTVVEKHGARIAIRDVQVGERVVVEPRSEPKEGRAGQTLVAAHIVVLLEVAH